MSYLKDFRKKIEKNDYHQFLKLWEEYYHSEQPDGEELIQILKEAKNSSLAVSFGHHVDRALYLWKLLQDEKQKDEVLKLILDIQKTNTEELATVTYDYLHKKYGHDKYFAEKIRLIGLRDNMNFQGAISNYELLSHLDVGKYVFHTAGWGTGEIIEISLIREEMTIEFEYVVDLKTLTFKKALNTLLPLSNDHFLAKRFGNPDDLEQEAKKSPVKVIALLLKDLGPKTAAEIKDELCELVIPEKQWSKWWQTTRTKLKKTTSIESPSSASKPFKLREKEISHENLLYASLEKKPNIDKTIQLVYAFIRDFPQSLKNQEFTTTLYTKITDLLTCEEICDFQKIQLYFLLKKITKDKKYSDEIENIITTTSDFNTFLNSIHIISFKKKVINLIHSLIRNWNDILLDQLFKIKENLLRDYILEILEKEAKDLLIEKLSFMLSKPLLYPKVFVWYFQIILKNKKHPLADRKYLSSFFEGFMIILDRISQDPMQKDLIKKMIHTITANRYKLIRDYFEKASIEEVKELLLLSTKCFALSNHDIKIIHSLGEVVFPQLKNIRKQKEPVSEEIWTTKEGYNKIKNKINEIASKEMIQNAQEIEEARSHGDLRENAEYKAALEKRDRLQSELQRLSKEFNQAKILTPDQIDIRKVGPGSVVECEKSNKVKVRFTILGPWEADPDNNVLSFQSQLAQKMINLKVGDEFSFQEEKYKIINIYSFFD